jgi:hypothetical protein
MTQVCPRVDERPFLVREDNGQLLTAEDLAPLLTGGIFVWAESDHGLVSYSVDRGLPRMNHELRLTALSYRTCRRQSRPMPASF